MAELTRREAAEQELADRIAAVNAEHEENAACEVRRWQRELQDADRVYRLRLGLPEP